MEKLKRLRESRGIKQKHMADSIGVDRHLYCHIENGRAVLNPKDFRKACAEFNALPNDLATEEEVDYGLTVSKPKRTDNRKLTHSVKCRLEPELLERFSAACKANGTTMQDELHRLIESYVVVSEGYENARCCC